MIVKIIQFRRAKESPYEKGILIEDSELVVGKDGFIVGEVYDIVDCITVIDFRPLLADTLDEFQRCTSRDMVEILKQQE